MKPLPKQYDPKEAELRWQQHWERDGTYAYRDDKPREQTYVIDTPPPTVSGVLHMGHIFSYTQADFIARYQRMSGMDVFYPMGFDDNGLPTERLVEKKIGKRAVDMPREEFIKICQEVTKEYEDQFRDLFKSVALSVDWKQEYQTISEHSRRISQMSFVDLYNKGHAYRDFRPTYWDWVDQTAIAQAEIENKEMPGVMNEIEFTLEGGGQLMIATTRPELLGACVAVMYHPEDPNAAKYKGKHAITPLFGVKVPMIADELVERDKGTGLVMCCTFGDDTDKEWWKRHKLQMRPLLQKSGKCGVVPLKKIDDSNIESIFFGISTEGSVLPEGVIGPTMLAGSVINAGNCIDINKAASAFNAIDGLKPKQANAKVIELLGTEGKLLKQTNITHTVKCAERSGTPIEIIPTQQWYVRIMDKKEPLTKRGAECNWHPEFMHIRLNQWIDGLKEDWCISRQRYSGVPFPTWFSKRKGEEGKILVAEASQLPVNPLVDLPKGYTRDEVEADKDIMDTWATSSVSPQISAKSLTPNKLLPADLRPQAHEIIRTWAFYTIVKAHLHADSVPWKNLMISGWCLAADKTKMSKSKGNVVTPVELIRDKGADAVRYWASTSRLGADTAFSEDLLKIGKKLVTKLWNATSFAAIHLSKIEGAPSPAAITAPLDRWIITRLHRTVAKATAEFKGYEYCDARVAVEEFFWKDFCDNYLELVKARAYGESGDATTQRSAHVTLYYCLDALLRLFAPFVPHVTEELYTHLFDNKGSVHAHGQWPNAAGYFTDDIAEQSGVAAVSVLEAVRKAKSEKNVSIKFPITQLTIAAKKEDEALLTPVAADLKAAGNIAEISFVPSLPDATKTEDGRFALSITFAAQADVA